MVTHDRHAFCNTGRKIPRHEFVTQPYIIIPCDRYPHNNSYLLIQAANYCWLISLVVSVDCVGLIVIMFPGL